MLAVCREHAGNARALARRHDGAALVRSRDVEASKQFRRGNGHLHLPARRAAFQAEVAGAVTRPCEDQQVEAACTAWGPSPKLHELGTSSR
jgi:hypothetical protein